jgi:hypothetical protein
MEGDAMMKINGVVVVMVAGLCVGAIHGRAEDKAVDLKKLPLVKFTYSPAEGLGPEKGVCRRDNSDVIKVGDTYYVWYSKVKNVPGVYQYPSGYSATIWYATSQDGRKWVEKGEALGKGGPGTWDEEGVYTPGILVANGKYYLGYDGADRPWTASSPAREGLAVADSPDGPWTKLASNPINNPTEAKYEVKDPKNFDSFRVCDVCILTRDGKYWWYYKGRGKDLTPNDTKLGVSIAEKPEGPYVKQPENPVVPGGHEVLAWPHGKGVAVVIGYVGQPHVRNTIQYAEDGIHFRPVARVANPPAAPGGYRPDAFTDSKNAEPMSWGISMRNCGGDVCLERFDCDLSGLVKSE